MDDLTPLDRQVATEFLRDAGPSEPVDDAAIFTAIATTQSPKWRFGSMFSAAKFVIAGVIVALFGGFLLAGMLTQQDGEILPAAVTESLILSGPQAQPWPLTAPRARSSIQPSPPTPSTRLVAYRPPTRLTLGRTIGTRRR